MLNQSYASIVATGQRRNFISEVIPFSFLPEEVLNQISDELTLVHYSKGTMLFVQGESKVEHIYIIQQGAVERYSIDDYGQKILRGMLGEGDTYGGISLLMNNGISVRTVPVQENTYFYILGKDTFAKLCKDHEAFSEFFSEFLDE